MTSKSDRVMFRYVSGAGLRSYRIKSRTDFLEGAQNITHGAKYELKISNRLRFVVCIIIVHAIRLLCRNPY